MVTVFTQKFHKVINCLLTWNHINSYILFLMIIIIMNAFVYPDYGTGIAYS